MKTQTKVFLTMTTEVLLEDNGYLGPTASVEEHVQTAIDHVKGWQFGVLKVHGGEFKPMMTHTKIDRVIIVPEEARVN